MPLPVRVDLPSLEEGSNQRVVLVSRFTTCPMEGLSRIMLLIAEIRDMSHSDKSVGKIIQDATSNGILLTFFRVGG